MDGLEISPYLLQVAKEHIEGHIDIKALQRKIETYHEAQESRDEFKDALKEADIVSSRIAELLSEETFRFSLVESQDIHRRLFSGILEHAGEIRSYNIAKGEWVLKGDTVLYTKCDSIGASMDHEFSVEKQYFYADLSLREVVKHIAEFTSRIWQVHPFGEGNTRTTAVFIIKYLNALGYSANITVFADNSWYFRNALVRSNYSDLQNNVHENTEFLEMFFENLLLGNRQKLRNECLHLDFKKDKLGSGVFKLLKLRS